MPLSFSLRSVAVYADEKLFARLLFRELSKWYSRVRFHKIIGGKGSETNTGEEIRFGLWSDSRLDRCRHHAYLSPSERNRGEPGSGNGGKHAHARNLQKLAEGPESDAEPGASSPSRGNRNVEKDVGRMDELAPQWAVQQNRDLLVEVKKQLPELRKVQEEAMGHAAGSERDATVRAGNEFADHATVIAEAVKQNLADMAASFIALLQQNKQSLDSQNPVIKHTTGGTGVNAVAIRRLCAVF